MDGSGVALVVAAVLVFAFAGWVMARPADPPVTTGSTLQPDSRPEERQLGAVFIGDSITAGNTPGFDRQSGDLSWVRHVTTAPESPWLEKANVAVGGEPTAALSARFRQDVLSRDPEAVVIMGGTNDALSGVPVQQVVANLREMVTSAQRAGVPVWLVSPPPNDARGAAVRELVAAMSDLAADLDVPFVDTFIPLASPSGGWARGMSRDGTHPTVEGAEALAETVLDQVAR